MGVESLSRGLAVEPETCAHELLECVERRRGMCRTVSGEEVRHLRKTLEACELVQAALGKPGIARRRCVRIGAARERPFGERQVSRLHGGFEHKTSARSVRTHVE